MRITTGPVDLALALQSCEQIESAIERIFSGELKPGKVPLEPICRLIQFVRDAATKEAAQYP